MAARFMGTLWKPHKHWGLCMSIFLYYPDIEGKKGRLTALAPLFALGTHCIDLIVGETSWLPRGSAILNERVAAISDLLTAWNRQAKTFTRQ